MSDRLKVDDELLSPRATILMCILWATVTTARQDAERAKQEMAQQLASQDSFKEEAKFLESIKTDSALAVERQLTQASYYLCAAAVGQVDRISGEVNQTNLDPRQVARSKFLNGDLLLASTNYQQGKTLVREALSSKLLPASDVAYAEGELAQNSKLSLNAFNSSSLRKTPAI